MEVTKRKSFSGRPEDAIIHRVVAVAVAAVAMFAAGRAAAQMPVPLSTQFDVSGFIEEATLGAGTSGLNVGPGTGAHQGGIIKVNGHTIIVPSETIVILPANALTWQELFAQAPAPYTGIATGMAIVDFPSPLTTYEAHVIGNRVLGGPGGADVYIAGLVYISQNSLNSGQGFINFIDYANGEMRVGGKINVDVNGNPVNVLDATNPGTRVRINDPIVGATGTGRYSVGLTPDRRFMVDQDNPTIASATGFPMCLPRVDPATAVDPLCPMSQRPLATAPATGFAAVVNTNDPRPICTDPPTNTIPAGCSPTGTGPLTAPSANIQIPMVVGDWVSFAGTLVTDAVTPTTGPWPANGIAGTYVSAHTVTSNVAVFTWPGTNPAYVRTDVTLIGTGGLNILGVGEATIRTRFEGMTTDPSRIVHLYGIDLNPATGATTDRDWGTIGADPGPPAGANKGRWRFRPPCLVFGTVPTKPDRQCVGNATGSFLPPTREMRAVIEGLQSQDPANPAAVATANGIFYGQYHAPISDYLFPENIPGNPVVENNFNALDFLAQGGYTSSAGTLAGILSPWPSNVLPANICVPPVASAGGPYTVASGGSVLLSASATGTPSGLTFTWTPPAQGTIAPLNLPSPTFTAPAVAVQTPITVTVTAANACGSSTASTTVTVNAALAPTVNHIPPQTVFSGQQVTLVATGTDPNVPALPLTFSFQQTAGPIVLVPNPKPGATQTFTRILPVGQTAPDVLSFQVTATNSAGVSSAPEFVDVTVKPLPDVVSITQALYRLGQQRLILTVTSSVVSPNVVLTVGPYTTQTGTLFTPPNPLLTNTGNGIYTITMVGVPEPFCGHTGTTPPACVLPNAPAIPLTVTSNLGGIGTSALTQVRQ